MTKLPSQIELFNRAENELQAAYRALSDARDWLRSDWDTSQPTIPGMGALRCLMIDRIDEAKEAINQARLRSLIDRNG